jgi:glutathione S-transferase
VRRGGLGLLALQRSAKDRLVNRTLDVATSSLASGLALGGGYRVMLTARQPAKLLELYEFESCPFCRKVREALTVFDLDARIYPSPPDGTRYRAEAIKLGGKAQFPLLIDPNTSRQMYESNEIIKYLAETYGDGSIPLTLRLGPITNMRSFMASMARPLRLRATGSRAPEAPLELYSFEASPFCRIAREALCKLEIPYTLHNVGKGSSKRDAFVARSGRMMVPFLIDPNTDTSMFESADIVRYLDTTYGA